MSNELDKPVSPELSDDELVRRFACSRNEEAFRMLVQRHAALVLGVASRVLCHSQDAEEVLQATFIVLAEKAKNLKPGRSLANWLYGVAYRISLRARSKKSRRRETPLPEITGSERSELEQLASAYEQQTLDDELNQLPRQFREPLVLHYLMGKTNRIIAEELGLSERTVEGRLRRGRRELRHRLIKRGISLGALMTAVAITHQELKAAVSTSAVNSIVQNSLQYPIGLPGNEAAALARKEVFAMTTAKMIVPTSIVAVALVGGAVSLATQPGEPGDRSKVDAISISPVLAQADNSFAEVAGFSGASDGRNQRPATQPTSNDDPFDPAIASTGADPFGASSKSPGGSAGSRRKDARDPRKPQSTAPSDFKRLSSAEQEIKKQLDSDTQLDFLEAPFGEVIDFMSEYHDIEVEFDNTALVAEGVDKDIPITRSVRGISLRNALGLLLDELELDYMMKHDVLLITSKARVASTPEARVYSTREITALKPDHIAENLRKTIRPETWIVEGAQPSSGKQLGTIELIPHGLIIRQSSHAHAEIADLLGQLKDATAKVGSPDDTSR